MHPDQHRNDPDPDQQKNDADPDQQKNDADPDQQQNYANPDQQQNYADPDQQQNYADPEGRLPSCKFCCFCSNSLLGLSSQQVSIGLMWACSQGHLQVQCPLEEEEKIEEKAKVVFAGWGTELIKLNVALEIQYQDAWEKWMIRMFTAH